VLEVVRVLDHEVDGVHQDVDLAAVESLVKPRRVDVAAGADEPHDPLLLGLAECAHGATVPEEGHTAKSGGSRLHEVAARDSRRR